MLSVKGNEAHQFYRTFRYIVCQRLIKKLAPNLKKMKQKEKRREKRKTIEKEGMEGIDHIIFLAGGTAGDHCLQEDIPFRI